MTSILYVGVDVHRKDNHFHCLDPSGQTIASFKQRNNRPGTERAIVQLTDLLQQGQFDELRLAAEATNWYWLPFFQLLASDPTLNQSSIKLYAFNPRVTAKYRDTFLDLDKETPRTRSCSPIVCASGASCRTYSPSMLTLLRSARSPVFAIGSPMT